MSLYLSDRKKYSPLFTYKETSDLFYEQFNSDESDYTGLNRLIGFVLTHSLNIALNITESFLLHLTFKIA